MKVTVKNFYDSSPEGQVSLVLTAVEELYELANDISEINLTAAREWLLAAAEENKSYKVDITIEALQAVVAVVEKAEDALSEVQS